MTYFLLRTVDLCWLEMEIAKGTIFYKANPWMMVHCGPFRDGAYSYDALSAREVLNMINKSKNVYWRN